MTYDVILLSPDNLNGFEEEIIDLEKKNGKTNIPRVKLNTKQVGNAFWFGVYGTVQQSRFLPKHSLPCNKKMFRHPIQLWQILCFVPQVPLNLSCLPNSVIVSMRLPCKFDNVTASDSENNYTFINKVSCLSCITSQGRFRATHASRKWSFFFSFFDCGFSQMFRQIVSITVTSAVQTTYWRDQAKLTTRELLENWHRIETHQYDNCKMTSFYYN